MRVFIYDCELFCEDCALAIIDRIRQEYPEKMSADEKREYQQRIKDGWMDIDEEWDSPEHCASHEKCINAIEIGEYKVGVWLENRLTSDGVKYVRDCARKKDGLLWDRWLEWYHDSLGLRIVG